MRPEVKARLTRVQTIVWDRGTSHNLEPTYCWPYHELLFVLRHTGGRYRKPRHDRLPMFRPDVWRIPPGAAPPGARKHNAEFPVDLAETVVSLWSEPGRLVCDPYMGRATTAVAARNLGRRFAGAEIQENYFKLAQDRLTAPVDIFGRAIDKLGREAP